MLIENTYMILIKLGLLWMNYFIQYFCENKLKWEIGSRYKMLSKHILQKFQMSINIFLELVSKVDFKVNCRAASFLQTEETKFRLLGISLLSI